MDMYEVFAQNPLLAILRNVPKEITLDYAGAIRKGGVKVFEVALNSPDALEQIAMLRKAYGGECLIGAGTAITVERCQTALDAGAQFLLTPGTPVDVLAFCRDHNVMLLPGVMTPTDVAVSLQYGFKTMKLFPAGDLPRSYVKDLKGPYDDTNYIAIGGVTPDNIPDVPCRRLPWRGPCQQPDAQRQGESPRLGRLRRLCRDSGRAGKRIRTAKPNKIAHKNAPRLPITETEGCCHFRIVCFLLYALFFAIRPSTAPTRALPLRPRSLGRITRAMAQTPVKLTAMTKAVIRPVHRP